MIPSQTPATTSQILSESPTIITTSNMTNNGTAGVTQSSGLETSAVTVIPSEKLPTKEATSGKTPTALVTSSGPEEKGTSSQGPLANKATPEASRIHDATFSAGVTVQEIEHALSPGSIAAITVTVIAVVLLVFGLAAFLKIRHSSYGRLFDDHDYGSWGNYNNPLYDDS
nr:prostate androgen-regulated mucin-like protein 1 isoform X2 [Pogona vitticeps]XP_020662873.1 prostate androgen-regulated mucin-like protein 1 isoform X2 [Pogona vitticeps]